MKVKEFILEYKFVIVMFLGIVVGTLYTNLSGTTGNVKWNVFNSDYLANYSDITVNSMILWQYVIKSRVRDFFLIVLLGLTALCKPFLLLYLFYVGICCGALISVAVMHYGGMGILMYLASILPQYILYGISMYFLYRILYKRTARLKNIGIVIGIAAVLLVIGTYLEAYLNPIILKNLYVYLY